MATVISNEDAKRHISQNLHRLLALHDPVWCQADLARAAKENVMTISHIVRGTRLPSAALLARIAEALCVSVDDLLSPPADAFSEKTA